MNKSTRLNSLFLESARAQIFRAYLAYSKAKVYTILYMDSENIKGIDIPHEQAFDKLYKVTSLNNTALTLKAISKKYQLENAYTVGTIAEYNAFKELYGAENIVNDGYGLEFFYRYLQGETIEDIKNSNNQVPFYKGADTKDGRQIKSAITGATIAKYETLLKLLHEKSYDNMETIKTIEQVIAIKADKTRR